MPLYKGCDCVGVTGNSCTGRAVKFDENGVLPWNTAVAVVFPLCVAGGIDWLGIW